MYYCPPLYQSAHETQSVYFTDSKDMTEGQKLTGHAPLTTPFRGSLWSQG